MRVSVLGSGSAGNSIFAWCGNTRILVDVGFSGKETARRLASIGVDADDVSDIIITHDHRDHTRGMAVFARRHGSRLHMTAPTRDACRRLLRGNESISLYEPVNSFMIGDVRVDPFVTIHDAADPAGVAVVDECSGIRLGIATDLGRLTTSARFALANSAMLVLESNHDSLMLHASRYPVSVRSRIASSHGHLSNEDAAQVATELLHPGLRAVVLAHLSKESNTPELALSVVGAALDGAGWRGRLEAASQDEPLPLIDLTGDGDVAD